MENTSRTVRFKPDELRLIEQFLKANPFFDFSSLTRTAITQFIRNPQLSVTPVTDHATKPKARKDAQHGSN